MQAKRLDAMEKMLETIVKMNQRWQDSDLGQNTGEQLQQGRGVPQENLVEKTLFDPDSAATNHKTDGSKNLPTENPSTANIRTDLAGLRQVVLQAEGESRNPEFMKTVGQQKIGAGAGSCSNFKAEIRRSQTIKFQIWYWSK